MIVRLSLLGMLAFGAVSASALGMSVIYGGDDRVDYYQVGDSSVRAMADATVALVRPSALVTLGDVTQILTTPYGQGMMLCPSEPFFEQEYAASCSGFLVTPDLIVTAGHCIRTAESCANTRFVFGFRLEAGQAQPRSVPTDHVFACKELLHSVAEATGEDFAVARLDRPVTFVAPLTLRSSGSVAVGEPLTVMGYPAGLPLKIAGGASVRSVQSAYLVANLDTYGGNSGSAVFNSVSGEVEGVLVRGEMDYRFENGCRSSNRCADDACRGEDVTLIERVLPFLK